MRALEGGEPADIAIAKVNRIARKKASQRKEDQERRAAELAAAANAPAFQFLANLNSKAGAEKPYDPVDGFDETNKYFVYREKYENSYVAPCF